MLWKWIWLLNLEFKLIILLICTHYREYITSVTTVISVVDLYSSVNVFPCGNVKVYMNRYLCNKKCSNDPGLLSILSNGAKKKTNCSRISKENLTLLFFPNAFCYSLVLLAIIKQIWNEFLIPKIEKIRL